MANPEKSRTPVLDNAIDKYGQPIKDKLLAELSRPRQKGGALICVTGGPGNGKSSVRDEISYAISRGKGKFISFDPILRDTESKIGKPAHDFTEQEWSIVDDKLIAATEKTTKMNLDQINFLEVPALRGVGETAFAKIMSELFPHAYALFIAATSETLLDSMALRSALRGKNNVRSFFQELEKQGFEIPTGLSVTEKTKIMTRLNQEAPPEVVERFDSEVFQINQHQHERSNLFKTTYPELEDPLDSQNEDKYKWLGLLSGYEKNRLGLRIFGFALKQQELNIADRSEILINRRVPTRPRIHLRQLLEE